MQGSEYGYMKWGELIAPVTGITLVEGRICIAAEYHCDEETTADHNDTVTVIGTDGSQIAHRDRISAAEDLHTAEAGTKFGLSFNFAAAEVWAG